MAYNLGHTIAEIRDMPYTDLQGWIEYFKRRPPGWREDDRIVKLLQIQGFKGRGEEVFNSLAQMRKQHEEMLNSGKGGVVSAGLLQSAFFQRLAKAKGSTDKIKGIND